MSPAISAIVPHPRLGDRVTIHVDRRPLAVIGLPALQRLGLRTGDALSAELEAQLQQEQQTLFAYDRAVAMLSRAPRSARDLRQRLIRKGEAAPAVDAAVERLRDAGLLNDEAFARHFARCRLTNGSRASAGVKGELLRRGVERALAEQATREVGIEEQVDEGASALNLALRRMNALRGLDVPTQRRRLSAYLQRRGFKTAQVMAAVAAALTRQEDGSR